MVLSKPLVSCVTTCIIYAVNQLGLVIVVILGTHTFKVSPLSHQANNFTLKTIMCSFGHGTIQLSRIDQKMY